MSKFVEILDVIMELSAFQFDAQTHERHSFFKVQGSFYRTKILRLQL